MFLRVISAVSHAVFHVLQHLLLHPLLHLVEHNRERAVTLFSLFAYLCAATVLAAPLVGLWFLAGDALLVLLILWRLMDCGPEENKHH